MENMVQRLLTDEELLEMRKEWKELDIEKSFPLFHFETYLDIEDYKKRVRKQLDDYKKQKK